MDIANEKSTSWIYVKFYDKDGVNQAPATVSYRIDCLTTGAEIKDNTAISPSLELEIQIDPADNEIQDNANKREHRRVTVTASYAGADQINTRFDYLIRNLKAVT